MSRYATFLARLCPDCGGGEGEQRVVGNVYKNDKLMLYLNTPKEVCFSSSDWDGSQKDIINDAVLLVRNIAEAGKSNRVIE